jgi:cyclopropane-fatty-acyl-phospholipid synthase
VTAADRLAAVVRDAAGIDLPFRVRAWDGSEAGPAGGPVLVVRNRRALRRLLRAPGELGLARAYVSGDIDVDGDIADGFRRACAMSVASRPASTGLRGKARAVTVAAGLGAIGPPPKSPASGARLSSLLHTGGRDRAAIAHHYDLSNDFYRLLLDDHMAYSSAYFTHEGQSLYDARSAKLDLVCRKLELKQGDRLLDVGCGWGSLILYATKDYGVHATGITLSAEQRAFIAERVAERGLSDKVDVRLHHYREFDYTPGSFDAVSSIEMGERVGEQHYPG